MQLDKSYIRLLEYRHAKQKDGPTAGGPSPPGPLGSMWNSPMMKGIVSQGFEPGPEAATPGGLLGAPGTGPREIKTSSSKKSTKLEDTRLAEEISAPLLFNKSASHCRPLFNN